MKILAKIAQKEWIDCCYSDQSIWLQESGQNIYASWLRTYYVVIYDLFRSSLEGGVLPGRKADRWDTFAHRTDKTRACCFLFFWTKPAQAIYCQDQAIRFPSLQSAVRGLLASPRKRPDPLKIPTQALRYAEESVRVSSSHFLMVCKFLRYFFLAHI